MPYKISKGGECGESGWGVYKRDSGELVACHKNRRLAEAQFRLLEMITHEEAKAYNLKHLDGQHDQADHGNRDGGASGDRILSPEEAARELERSGAADPVAERERVSVEPRNIPEYNPRDKGVDLRITAAQRDFIAGRESQTDGHRDIWDHVAAQLFRDPSASTLNLNVKDLKEILAVVRDEQDIHAYSDRGEYSAGERATINGLAKKIESLIEKAGGTKSLTLNDSKSLAVKANKIAPCMVPEGAKQAAKRGLALREEFGRGGTAVGAGRARQLIRSSQVSPEIARRIYSYFKRHEVDKRGAGFHQGGEGYPSAGLIAWLLWGGDAMYSAVRRWKEHHDSKSAKAQHLRTQADDEKQKSDNKEKAPKK